MEYLVDNIAIDSTYTYEIFETVSNYTYIK